MNLIWKNGAFIPSEQATVHVLSHSLHYGSGVFEGIRVYQTDHGPNIFKLDEHIERLFYSAGCMGMQVPYSQNDFKQAVIEIVKQNKLKAGYVRPIIFYGAGNALIVSPQANIPVECVIACWEADNYLPVELVDVKTSPVVRIPPSAGVMNAKICGQYANSLLAGLCIQNTHYHAVLMLDQNGFVAEGAAQNIFIVKNNTLYTPRADNILPGITRKVSMDIATEMGLNCHETNFSTDDVLDADEAFFTGSAAEIVAIRSLDDQCISSGEVGPITQSIQKAYQKKTHTLGKIETSNGVLM